VRSRAACWSAKTGKPFRNFDELVTPWIARADTGVRLQAETHRGEQI
jgi:hypothetical protein